MSRLRVSLYILALLFPAVTLAGTKDVKVETVPSGAQVEENGSIVCKTPCTLKVPSYYFGKKHTAFSSHGIEPIRLRITKEGFAPKSLDITTRPIHATNLYGNHLYDYYLVTTTQFTIQLNPVHEFVGDSQRNESPVSVQSSAALPTERIVHDVSPAVVRISGSRGAGSGFFITSDGLIVTNAHVVRSESSVTVTLSNGKSLESSAIYVDEDRDLAFVKIPGSTYPKLNLKILPPNPGADVIAIGSPLSEQLTNSVTKGVVSGIRHGDHGVDTNGHRNESRQFWRAAAEHVWRSCRREHHEDR